MKKRLLSALAVLTLLATAAFAATTTHYGWVTPTVGASQNTWGSTLNTAFNAIDTNLWAVAGGTTHAVNAPSASASNITLINPLSSTQNISFSGTGLQLILPPMNVSASMTPGGILTVSNVGANAFQIVAQDGATNIITSVPPNNTAFITLLSGSTANGTFQFTSSPRNAIGATLSVPLGGTGATTLTAHGVVVGNGTSAVNVTGAGTAGQIMTSNGASADPAFQDSPPGVTTGSMIIWTTTACPASYTYANGQAISRTTFASLFGVIGTTFGTGDGATTFNVPDTRGYFVRGWADNSSIDPGRTFGTVESDAIKSHSVASAVNDPGHTHQYIPGSPDGTSSGGPNFNTHGGSSTIATGLAFTGITVTSTYNGSFETRPVNLALVFCIKN